LLGKTLDQSAVRQACAPGLWDGSLAVIRPRELAIDGTRGIGIIAQVDREQAALPK